MCKADPDLSVIVSKWGVPPFWIHPPGFPGLVMSVLAQQVSLESARAAFGKLEKVLGEIEPRGFLALDNTILKAVGFSRQKASYVQGVAREIVTGAFDFAKLDAMDDADARKKLLKLRGIGPWTADTFLLFSLRRPDIWPSGDLALELAVRDLKNIPGPASSEEVNAIAGQWKPWRAVAARILWHGYLSERGRGA